MYINIHYTCNGIVVQCSVYYNSACTMRSHYNYAFIHTFNDDELLFNIVYCAHYTINCDYFFHIYLCTFILVYSSKYLLPVQWFLYCPCPIYPIYIIQDIIGTLYRYNNNNNIILIDKRAVRTILLFIIVDRRPYFNLPIILWRMHV